MNSTNPKNQQAESHETILASYQGHTTAEEAMSYLAACGLPLQISIIGSSPEMPEMQKKSEASPADASLYRSDIEVQAGEFQIVVRGSAQDTERARQILKETSQAPFQKYATPTDDPGVSPMQEQI